MVRSVDLVIFGAGIAGLWAFHQYKKLGYDVLLLETEAIGHGQTIAAQGIIHSGLKFKLAGKINTLAQKISNMPQIWRECMNGNGPVDLRSAKINAPSQLLLIPSGFMGGLTKMMTTQILGRGVHEIQPCDWPRDIISSGFKGSVVDMAEMVLDVPSVLRALAEPYKDCIRRCAGDPLEFLQENNITAKKIIFTTAQNNALIAKKHGHDRGLQTQARPLLQGLLRPAPFELYAHLVGASEKPVATITTHTDKNGNLVWYLGAGVAERQKESNPNLVYNAVRTAFAQYFPNLNFQDVEWAALPIDRIEGKSKTDHWMPDTPTLHRAENCLYAWPTKMTFAPLLGDMILSELKSHGIEPSHHTTDFGFLDPVDYAPTPWDEAQWTN